MRCQGMKCAAFLWATVFAVGLLLPAVSHADRFYLTEDRLIEGILVREDTATVTFKLDGAGLWTLSRHSLHRVDRESPGEYWMRVGERHARGNRIDRARDAFEKAQMNSDTEKLASRRLKDLDLLDRSTEAAPPVKTAKEAPKKKTDTKEDASPKLSEIKKEKPPAVAAVSPSLPPRSEKPVEKPKVEEKKASPKPPAPKTAKKTSTSKKPAAKKKGTRKKTVVEDKKYSDIIRKYAQYHGVDPLLVKAIITVESRWDPRATSKSGAQGLMQLMPETAASLGVKNAYDPEQNIRAGVKYLSQINKQFRHLSWRKRHTHVVAAYNAGPNLIKEVGDYRKVPKALRYTNKVMAAYDELRDQKNAEFAYLDRRLGR